MLYLGIDPSLTGSGLSLIDSTYSIISKLKLSTPTAGVERLFHLENKFLEFINAHAITFVAMEGGAYRETGRIFHLGQWAGILQLVLYKKGITFIEVAPLQLKKYVSGIGKNKGKETIILDVFKNFGEEIRDSDLADAYVLARIAHDYYSVFVENKQVPLHKYQIDVLNNLNKDSTAKIKEII